MEKRGWNLKLDETIAKFKNILAYRKQSYERVFDLKNPYAETVLKDLARFCRANTTCFHENDKLHMVYEGRREVWLRIMEHTKMTSDEFWEKYGRE